MKGPNPNWLASASSSHSGNTADFGAHFAIDGIEVKIEGNYWHNDESTLFGWFQLDMGIEYYVKAVNISTRLSNWETFDFQEAFKEVGGQSCNLIHL